MKNLYDILNVNKNSSLNEIRLSYRHLIKTNHPDVGGNLERCKELNVAYGILSDPYKKKEYDSLNIDQQNKKYDLIKKFFKFFLYKDKEFETLLDFFFYNDPSKTKVSKKEEKSKKETAKEDIKEQKYLIVLDVDESYNKKYYKYTINGIDYVVPVANGEYYFEPSIYIEISIVSSPTIKIKDNDIIVEEFIDIHDYIYGFNLNLKLPNGIKIEKKIDSFLHRDTIELIENAGLYYIKTDYEGDLADIEFDKGDLYIDFKVKDIDGTNYIRYSNLKEKIKQLCKKEE